MIPISWMNWTSDIGNGAVIMIIVIQCQGRKQHDAGRLQSASGKPVIFVAQPELAPRDDTLVYARPDDLSDNGMPWRKVLLDYNRDVRNPLGLYPAYRLYKDSIYGRLAERFGLQNLYILSAGWGLIGAGFLTAYYDITFSQSAAVDQKFKRRRKSDRYHDFSMLPADTDDPILFFGSKEYVPLFCSLTKATKSRRTVFYNAKHAPEAPGCFLKKFDDAKRDRNWQYDCASAFLDGAIDPK